MYYLCSKLYSLSKERAGGEALINPQISLDKFLSKKIPRKTSILRTKTFRKILTKIFQKPKLTPSKLENSEQKNLLPEKTPKNAYNSKILKLKTLQPHNPKYAIFLHFLFSKTYRFTHQNHRFCFSR